MRNAFLAMAASLLAASCSIPYHPFGTARDLGQRQLVEKDSTGHVYQIDNLMKGLLLVPESLKILEQGEIAVTDTGYSATLKFDSSGYFGLDRKVQTWVFLFDPQGFPLRVETADGKKIWDTSAETASASAPEAVTTGTNGEVYQAENFIKRKLGDQGKYQSNSWGKLTKAGDKYIIWNDFDATNEGKAVNLTWTFLLDHRGAILSVVDQDGHAVWAE